MALQELSEEEIQKLNTFMNLRDPLKDSFMVNHKKDTPDFRLDMKIHGPLIKGILNYLYVAQGQGGGGRNVAIEREITQKFGANVFTEGPSQQYSVLRFDANDRRIFTLSKKNLVIDTGSATTFGDDCKTVIGPFSVIDPGPRSLEGSINLLQQNMTFDYTDGPSGLLGMEGYITSVEYKHVAGTHPYQFTISFAEGNEETFAYKRIRTRDDYCTNAAVNNSTNYNRNAYIKQIFDAHPSLNSKNMGEVLASGIPNMDMFVDTVAFQLWWKLMGDSSFPLWIQEYLDDRGRLTYENTLVASTDWGVIYRSLINGMPCAHKSETNVTYYPIIKGVLDRGILQGVAPPKKRKRQGGSPIIAMKRAAFKSLIKSNQYVVDTIEQCKQIAEENPMFLISSITEPRWVRYRAYASFRQDIIRTFTRDVCNTMLHYIKPIIQAIAAHLEPLVAVDDGDKGFDTFNEKVEQCMLDCPFVVLNRNEFTVIRSEFVFLSAPFEEAGDEIFNLDSIYKLYDTMNTELDEQTGEYKHPTVSEIVALLKKTYNAAIAHAEEMEEEEVIVVEEEEQEDRRKRQRREDQGGGGLSQESMLEYTELLKNNRHLPNFLLWFVQQYIPEFFFMALAYDLALHPVEETLEKYKPVFKHSLLEKALVAFGKPVDGYIEYDPPRSRASRSRSGSATRSVSAAAKLNRNSLILHAAGILKGVRDPEKNLLFRLSKEKAPELAWFIETIGVAAIPVPEEKKATVHSAAIWYYQKLYRADTRLCIQNKRKLQSPVDALRIVETAGAKVEHTMSESAKARVIRTFESIRRKHPSPVRRKTQKKRASPLLKRLITLARVKPKSQTIKPTKKRISVVARRTARKSVVKP